MRYQDFQQRMNKIAFYVILIHQEAGKGQILVRSFSH